MRARNATWVAEITIDGCEQERAEELADLAADLALVAIQFAVPKYYSRHMARITGRTLPPSVGSVHITEGTPRFSIHNHFPGFGLDTGTFEHFLEAHSRLMESVGSRVSNFINPNSSVGALERQWCDAAYWFHEGLAEPQATVAVAKLETSIEVLFGAGNNTQSKQRLCEAIEAFYGHTETDLLPSKPPKTVAKFVKEIVGARSRVLHGTFSTLTENVEAERADLEALSFDLLRQTSLALDEYAKTSLPKDDAKALLSWISRSRRSGILRDTPA